MNKLMEILRGKRKDKKGFTLMEMLIVVAIIAVLVAIAVPTFNSSLGSAKKAADEANMRTAKIVASSMFIDHEYDENKPEIKAGYWFDVETGTFSKDVPAAYGRLNKDGAIKVTSVGTDGTIKLEWDKTK